MRICPLPGLLVDSAVVLRLCSGGTTYRPGRTTVTAEAEEGPSVRQPRRNFHAPSPTHYACPYGARIGVMAHDIDTATPFSAHAHLPYGQSRLTRINPSHHSCNIWFAPDTANPALHYIFYQAGPSAILIRDMWLGSGAADC